MTTTHDLTYPGIVDPAPGTLMGPGLDARSWRVVGSVFDVAAKQTTVTVEAVSA